MALQFVIKRPANAIRGAILVMLVAAVTSAAPAPQQHQRVGRFPSKVRFTSGAIATIPIGIESNHIAMRGWLQGKDSIRVVLDTGASNSVMDSARAVAVGLEGRGRHQAMGAGGAVASTNVRNVRLGLPGLEIEHSTMGVIPLDPVAAQGGRKMDFILGYPLFSKAVVEIDYQAGLLRVHDPDSFVYRGSGVSVPIELVHNHPYVKAKVKLPGREPVDGKFIIDTGSSMALILSPDFVAKEKALEAVTKTMTVSGRGVGGLSMNPIGRVESFEIGGIELKEPTAIFRSPGPGVISAPGTAGNIGGMILRRFKVIFDYPNGRMILEPTHRLADAFEADMSGLGLTTDLPDFQVVRVQRVTENTPATDVGIRVGDRIETVDGRRAVEIGLPTLREWFRRDGMDYRLGIKRGEESIEVTLRTRRMI